MIEKLGPRKAVQVGSFCYMLWVVAGLLPVTIPHTDTTKIIVWVVMMTAGIINGIGASILWVGQGKYINDCSTAQNRGFFFGLFWCIFMVSQILGSLIAAFLLDSFSQTVFFIVMSGFAALGFISFLFLKKPEPPEQEEAKSQSDENPLNDTQRLLRKFDGDNSTEKESEPVEKPAQGRDFG